MSKNTYDPKHIADTMKKLRESYKLTQENLALSAGLSTRTIEKLESGRHTPEEQTLRSIARALNVDVEIFATPDPEAEAKAKAQLEEALRTKLLVRTEPIRTANDFLKRFGEWEGWRFSFDQVEGDQAMEVAAEIGDWLQDMDGIWELMNTSQRLDTARGFADMCTRLEALGYLCHMGHHKQRMRTKGKSDLVFSVGLLCLLPKVASDGERYAIITLEHGWETMPEDQVLPGDK